MSVFGSFLNKIGLGSSNKIHPEPNINENSNNNVAIENQTKSNHKDDQEQSRAGKFFNKFKSLFSKREQEEVNSKTEKPATEINQTNNENKIDNNLKTEELKKNPEKQQENNKENSNPDKKNDQDINIEDNNNKKENLVTITGENLKELGSDIKSLRKDLEQSSKDVVVNTYKISGLKEKSVTLDRTSEVVADIVSDFTHSAASSIKATGEAFELTGKYVQHAGKMGEAIVSDSEKLIEHTGKMGDALVGDIEKVKNNFEQAIKQNSLNDNSSPRNVADNNFSITNFNNVINNFANSLFENTKNFDLNKTAEEVGKNASTAIQGIIKPIEISTQPVTNRIDKIANTAGKGLEDISKETSNFFSKLANNAQSTFENAYKHTSKGFENFKQSPDKPSTSPSPTSAKELDQRSIGMER